MRNTTSCGESFEVLVNTYQRRLYVYALRILRNREDAEEAVQDAFVKAYRTWARFDAKPPYSVKLKSWLYKITLSVSRNRLREKQLMRINVLTSSASPDAILDRHATVELVERTIRDLPSHLLEAARLRFIEGLTLSEIASRSSQPVGTVKSHVFRARQLLRQLLGPMLAGTV